MKAKYKTNLCAKLRGLAEKVGMSKMNHVEAAVDPDSDFFFLGHFLKFSLSFVPVLSNKFI